MERIPPCVWNYIMTYLSYIDVLNVAQVNKDLNSKTRKSSEHIQELMKNPVSTMAWIDLRFLQLAEHNEYLNWYFVFNCMVDCYNSNPAKTSRAVNFIFDCHGDALQDGQYWILKKIYTNDAAECLEALINRIPINSLHFDIAVNCNAVRCVKILAPDDDLLTQIYFQDKPECLAQVISNYPPRLISPECAVRKNAVKCLAMLIERENGACDLYDLMEQACRCDHVDCLEIIMNYVHLIEINIDHYIDIAMNFHSIQCLNFLKKLI